MWEEKGERAVLFLRLTYLLTGIAIAGVSIAAVAQAGLGISPISTLPFVLSKVTDFSFGAMNFAVNLENDKDQIDGKIHSPEREIGHFGEYERQSRDRTDPKTRLRDGGDRDARDHDPR